MSIKVGGAGIAGVKFQGGEVRTASAPPFFAGLQQPPTDALPLELSFDGDLGNMTVNDCAVHRIGRLF